MAIINVEEKRLNDSTKADVTKLLGQIKESIKKTPNVVYEVMFNNDASAYSEAKDMNVIENQF